MLFSPHEPRNVPERFVALIPKVCTRAVPKTPTITAAASEFGVNLGQTVRNAT
jgi:hypothetical protein